MRYRIRTALMILLPAASAAAAAGCYTVLRHPEPSELVAEDTGARRACADCHVDSEFFRDAFDPHTYGFGAYATYPGWSDYYFRPWWYKDYWYYGNDEGARGVETGGEHLWGGTERRSLGTGGITPVFPGQTSGPYSPGASSPSATPPAAKPVEQKSEEKRDAEPHRTRDRREMGTTGKPASPQKPPETPPPPPDSSGGSLPR